MYMHAHIVEYMAGVSSYSAYSHVLLQLMYMLWGAEVCMQLDYEDTGITASTT